MRLTILSGEETIFLDEETLTSLTIFKHEGNFDIRVNRPITDIEATKDFLPTESEIKTVNIMGSNIKVLNCSFYISPVTMELLKYAIREVEREEEEIGLD